MNNISMHVPRNPQHLKTISEITEAELSVAWDKVVEVIVKLEREPNTMETLGFVQKLLLIEAIFARAGLALEFHSLPPKDREEHERFNLQLISGPKGVIHYDTRDFDPILALVLHKLLHDIYNFYKLLAQLDE